MFSSPGAYQDWLIMTTGGSSDTPGQLGAERIEQGPWDEMLAIRCPEELGELNQPRRDLVFGASKQLSIMLKAIVALRAGGGATVLAHPSACGSSSLSPPALSPASLP